MIRSNASRTLALVLASTFATSLALAQQSPANDNGGPGMPPGAGGPPVALGHGGMRHGLGPDGGGAHRGPGGEGGPGHDGMMGIVPPGMWWKNPEVVTNLGLTADQTTRLDDIVRGNRIQLIRMHAALEEAEVNLEPLLNANTLDQGRVLVAISKIADQRADLEKTNAKMLLGLRSVLTPEQWAKLRDQHGRRDRGPKSGGAGGPARGARQ